MKTVLVYALLALAFANVAYARHDCQPGTATKASVSVDTHAHAVERATVSVDSLLHHHRQESTHSHNCVCPNGHAQCSGASATLSGATELVQVQMQIVPGLNTSHTRPFPAHLADLIRPPITLI